MININEDVFGMIFITIMIGIPFIYCMWEGYYLFKEDDNE